VFKNQTFLFAFSSRIAIIRTINFPKVVQEHT